MNDVQSLYENMVVEWKSSDSEDRCVERILWISPVDDLLCCIVMGDEKAFPNMRTHSEYTAAFKADLLKQVDWINDNIPLLDYDINSEHLLIRDKSWDAIKDIVTDEPDCFEKGFRGLKIREVQARTGIHKSTIYRYLRRYWQGGKMKNSLLPHFNNCGNVGNDRAAKESKRGRPRKFEDEPVGINIDEEIKQLLRSGIKLFYNNKDKSPLKHAYQKTLEKFFASGFRQEGQALIPVLPSPDELPTFGQYKYWFNKEMNLEDTITSRHGKKGSHWITAPFLEALLTKVLGQALDFRLMQL